MKGISLFVVIGAVALCSCSVTGNLYPVEGPLSDVRPLPVIPIEIRDVQRNTGRARLVLPSGEVCLGQWSVVAPRMAGVVTTTGSGTVSSGLDSVFVQVHGQSFVNVAAPGINKGQAILTGDRGTVIEAAFLVGSGTASGHGVARDDRGNVFKVLF